MSKKKKNHTESRKLLESITEDHLSPGESIKKWLFRTYPKLTKILFLIWLLFLAVDYGVDFLQKYKQTMLISSIYHDYCLYINPVAFTKVSNGDFTLTYDIANDGNQTINIVSHHLVHEFVNTTIGGKIKLSDFESIGPTYSFQVQKNFSIGYWHPYTDSRVVDSLIKIEQPLATFIASDSIRIVINKDTISIKKPIGKVTIYSETKIEPSLIVKSKILIYD